MTTKQGESYLKNKLFPIIENMEPKAESTKNIKSEANPVVYSEVEAKNKKHAVDALESCKKKCQEITQVEACNLGCQIKYEANSDSTDTMTKATNLANPYDRWKKSYSTVVDKNSNTKISDAYKKWSPFHTYGNIWNGRKRVYYYYWTYYWGYRCYWSRWWWSWYRRCYWYPKWYRRRTYYWKPSWRWGITRRGRRVTVPAVWKKCNWKELHKYPKENTGRFNDNIEAKSCDDIITSNNIPDTEDPDYYRDYSIHNMVDACKFGMNNYERKNCKVAADKETITCNETRSYGSIEFDTQNYQNEQARLNALTDGSTDGSTETFTNKKKEGFSNACETQCSKYINGDKQIIDMNSNSECYKCEVKYNPYIRYSAPREKLIEDAKYKATLKEDVGALNHTLYNLRGQQESQKRKLDAKTITYIEVKTGKGGTTYTSLTEPECKKYASDNHLNFGINDTNPKGCIKTGSQVSFSSGDEACSSNNICIEKSLSDNSQTALVYRNKALLDELYPIHQVKVGKPDLSVSQNSCKEYASKNNLAYEVEGHEDNPKGCFIQPTLDPTKVYYNTNQNSTAKCGANNASYCLQRDHSKSYSKKRHVNINAYLEDMKTKNPSKNVEYGIWIGLLAAAGISTAVLLKD